MIGVILARGGSKGIPRKNLQEVNGVSLIKRCCQQASGSMLSRVFVYSDDAEILQEASSGGAVPVDRPEKVSGDTITSEESLVCFLDQVKPKDSEMVMMLQCTTPFLKEEHINCGVQKLRSVKYNSVISATRCDRYLGYKSAQQHGSWVPMYPCRWLRQRHGSLFWMENGGFYATTQHIWRQRKRISRRCGIVLMDWWESMEIDEPEDLEIARAIAPIIERSGSHAHSS